MIKKLLIPLLVTTGLLVGCSDKPMNFSCTNTSNPRLPVSLSISNGGAKLGFSTYKAECHTLGNTTTYAASKKECALAGSDSTYSNLVFDNVVFTAYANDSSPGASTQEIYTCKKVD